MQKEKQDKIVSLEDMYWQIQRWLDQADMGNVGHSVEVKFAGYEHYKTGKFSGIPVKDPKKTVTIFIGEKLTSHEVSSPTIAMEKTRTAIELMQLERDNKDTIANATMIVEDSKDGEIL